LGERPFESLLPARTTPGECPRNRSQALAANLEPAGMSTKVLVQPADTARVY
jgi:hypothetical protein